MNATETTRLYVSWHVLGTPFFLAAGIAFERWRLCDPIALAVLAVLSAVILARSNRKNVVVFVLAGAIGVGLIWRHDHRTLPADSLSLTTPSGKTDVTAYVVRKESARKTSSRYLLDVVSVDGQKRSGLARWYMRETGVSPLPGDLLRISKARIRKIRGYRNIGGWDYERYMKDRAIAATVSMTGDSVVKIIGSRFSWLRPVERLKDRLRDNISFKRKDATAVARAMLIGDRGLLAPEIRETFSRAGTAHLLAVSGLHVGFVALAVYLAVRLVFFLILYPVKYEWVSAGLPSQAGAAASLAATIGYGALTGPAFSSTRAAVMVSVYLTAVLLGRGRDFLGAFAAAFMLILVINPWALFESGFQLSFAAVFAITALMERMMKHGEQDAEQKLAPSRREILLKRYPALSGCLLASVFASIGAAPLAALHFNVFPSYGIIVNAALVPLASLAVPLGIVSAMTGFGPGLFATGWMIGLIIDSSTMTEKLPFAFGHTGDVTAAVAVFYYLALASFVFIKPGRPRRILIGASLAVSLLIALSNRVADALDNTLTVHFMDVGQGDCAVATWPEGGAMVIDGGNRYDTFDIGRSIVAPSLFRGLRNGLSVMIASHGDADHVYGLPGLASLVPPGSFSDSGLISARNRNYLALRAKERAEGAYRMLRGGDRVDFPGGLVLKVYNPPRGKSPYRNARNNRSLVVKLVFGKTRVLFTGDIEYGAERWLLDSGADIRADVLKVAHHGADTSSSTEFLKAVGAKTAVISVGEGNGYGHPSENAVRRLVEQGMKIYRTDMDGEIVMRTDGKTINWKTYSEIEAM